MSDPYPTFIALLTTATQELFSLHGLSVTPAKARGAPESGAHILGTIGFGGGDMKGALAILADETLWRAIAPVEVAATDRMLADMVGEFANMLLGRVRNAVLPLGAEVASAIPSVVYGTNLAFHRAPVARPDWQVFRSDAGPIFVRLVVAFRRDFEFCEASEWSVRPNEADLVLF